MKTSAGSDRVRFSLSVDVMLEARARKLTGRRDAIAFLAAKVASNLSDDASVFVSPKVASNLKRRVHD